MTGCWPAILGGLAGAALGGVLAAWLLTRRYRRSRELERQELTDQKFLLAERNLAMLELKEQLEEEQAKTQKLLRNILPERVICELRDHGHSTPESFESVSVFFSDIVDFTSHCAEIEPVELISELSEIFGEFDRIFSRHGCERIKTIGDAYLSVSGLPEPNPRHWRSILRAALAAREYLRQRNQARGLDWRMRMGIHCGRVVGGIVGTEKYIYDIFGDTVNTAARMENHSGPMRINVSETVYQLAREEFDFEARPLIEVKGKGRMQMYFLLGEKAHRAGSSCSTTSIAG